MSAKAASLLNTALKLSSRDRAQLASELIASLDGPADDGVEEAWSSEVERRIDEVDTGRVKLLDWEPVKVRSRRSAKKTHRR